MRPARVLARPRIGATRGRWGFQQAPKWALALTMGVAVSASAAPPLVVSDGRVRLGVADSPEWDTFANDPPQTHRLDVRFQAETNEKEATLRIRQDDVKQEWAVQLNGTRLGKLFLMEADLFHRLPIPGGALRAGENLLSIFQTAPNAPDDIVLHEVAIERDPPESGLVKVTALVDDKEGVPCRITVVDRHNTLAAMLPAENADAAIPASLAMRPGVVYTADGRVTISLPVGGYTLFASRGFEFGVARADVEVRPNVTREVRLALRREVATPGWVSCDTHTHTFTHSGHGDATVEERVLTIAGEGIELPVATDHNLHVDLTETAARRGVDRYFTPVIGNEVTTAAGHFNIFPIAPGARVVDAKITDWSQLIPAMRKTPGVRMIVLNHPRSIHSGFRPFDPTHFNAVTGENRRGGDFAFDALELVNSGAQQSDYMRVYHDWFALLNHGHRVVGVGASDSHDVSRFIVGQARTYIAAADDHPGSIDVDEACANLRAGRALVSMGLFAEMIVNGSYRAGDIVRATRDELHVDLRIFAPSWSRATEAVVYANGIPVSEIPVEQSTGDASSRAEGNSTRIIRTIRRVRHDVHLVAIVTGPAVTAPFWAMTKPYQPNSRQWTGRAIASTNPVWVDADRDGQFTSAREYARQVVGRHTNDPTALFAELAQYDAAVAAQAASLLAAGGAEMKAAPFVAAQKGAARHVVEGFAKWLAAEEAGRAALPKIRE